MGTIVELIDDVLSNIDDENTIQKVAKKVNEMMNNRPLNAW
jgi:glycine hydroxymethyltransferase